MIFTIILLMLVSNNIAVVIVPVCKKIDDNCPKWCVYYYPSHADWCTGLCKSTFSLCNEVSTAGKVFNKLVPTTCGQWDDAFYTWCLRKHYTDDAKVKSCLTDENKVKTYCNYYHKYIPIYQ